MIRKLQVYFLVVLLSTLTVFSQVRITEVMSSSGTGGTADWIEVTNLGNSSVDITGWKIDDNTYNFSAAVELTGVTTIPAGKSVVFIESAVPTTDIPAFKSFWGSSMNNISVGSYTGSGVGFSSTADGVVLFNALGVEITSRVSFGAATAGKSFYFSYNADGSIVDNAVISALGTINGTVSNQVTLKSSSIIGDIGSPGTAIVLPLNLNTINPSMKPWRLEGRTLKFDVLPSQNVELYALTGTKAASHAAAREIKLELKQGIYILKVDGKATKITIR
ncbi:MAG: lamin tail domain-containing protein [Paludibacter sp.]